MIILYLSVDLAAYIASHLPADDPLRAGLAESVADEERFPTGNEPPALTILRRGSVLSEVYDEDRAEQIVDVLCAPRAWPIVLEQRKQNRKSA